MHDTYRLAFAQKNSRVTWPRPIREGVRVSVSEHLRLWLSTVRKSHGVFKRKRGQHHLQAALSLGC